MDPIEVFETCRNAAHSQNGISDLVYVPQPFEKVEYQQLWRTNPKGVRKLLDDTLCGPCPANGLNLLFKMGALQAVIPELKAIVNLGDADGLHKDVWSHTMGVVSGVPNTLELRWSALLHDIGKARTRKIIEGKVTFHNHDLVGARIVERMQNEKNLFQDDVALYRTVRMLVLNHLRPAAYKASWSDSGVRRLLSDCADPGLFEKLMVLSRADLTTKIEKKRLKCARRADELEARVAEIRAADAAPRLPKNTMGIILAASERKAGPWLGAIHDKLVAELRSGLIPVDASAETCAERGRMLLDDA